MIHHHLASGGGLGWVCLLFIKSSKEKDSSELKDILSIPYDYSGYDLVFEEGTTDIR